MAFLGVLAGFTILMFGGDIASYLGNKRRLSKLKKEEDERNETS